MEWAKAWSDSLFAEEEEEFSKFMNTPAYQRVSETLLTIIRLSYSFGWRDRGSHALRELALQEYDSVFDDENDNNEEDENQ